MLEQTPLQALALRIRSSEALGRSDLIRGLFDFLVECSLTGRVPKEIEIAVDVFGKSAGFEGAQDSMVRVYIHKLRRKLEQYYAGPGRQDAGRLVIPKGEYRLVCEPMSVPGEPPVSLETAEFGAVDSDVIGSVTPWYRRRPVWLVGLIFLVLANAGLWLAARPVIPATVLDVMQARASGVWAPLLRDGLPIYVVVGDYYLFGELSENGMDVQRLIRDFDINSQNDLEQFLKNHPQLADRYMDVNLQYLPISAAYALRNVLPLLDPGVRRGPPIQVVLASDLTPDMIKSSHIVYIGLISGMRLLQDVAFSGSQLQIGDSYDELIDRPSQRRYVSQAGTALDQHVRFQDYGYFSTFDGPKGNHIIILAGTRDVALMHIAEALSHAAGLEQLLKQAHVASNFEALYSVEGLDRSNLGGCLLFTGKLDTAHLWSGPGTALAVVDVTNESRAVPSVK